MLKNVVKIYYYGDNGIGGCCRSLRYYRHNVLHRNDGFAVIEEDDDGRRIWQENHLYGEQLSVFNCRGGVR